MISALVCTRNRPGPLVRTLRSLLRPGGEVFELIVMDQSDDPSSEAAVAAFATDERLHYVRSGLRGKGAALNEGLRIASGDIVVCTDDDCEAPAGWVQAMARVMEAQPDVAVVFCHVAAEPYDRSAGYVPTYEPRRDRHLLSLADARKGIGLGAGMALRRNTILAMGGVDQMLGPGSRFGSGDDWDLTVRVLLMGWQVYDTASVSIIHHGFRTFAEGRVHALRDWRAIGALCAKPIRAGRMSAAPLAVSLFWQHALWPPIRDLLRMRRPIGAARVVGFLQGFVQGIRTPVERETLLFRPRR